MTELSRRGFLLSAGSLAIASASGLLLLPRPLRAAMGPNDKFDLVTMATANPARVINRAPKLGSLQIGAPGDVTVLEVIEGPVEFVDTRNNKRAGKVHLKPAHAVAAGVAFGRPYQAPFTVR